MNRTSMEQCRATYPESRTRGKIFAAIAAAFVSLSLMGGVLGLFELQAGSAKVAAVESTRSVIVT